MKRDYLGNAVSGERDTTLRCIDDFIEGYLAYETRAEQILPAADADPGSCMANVYAGILWMLLEAPQAASRATKYLREEAEFEARTALAMRRKEPWAQHALAHVLLTRGRMDEGAQFLEEAADTWSG